MTAKKYRKLPVVIEAIQFTGTYKSALAIMSWAEPEMAMGIPLVPLVLFEPNSTPTGTLGTLKISTLEGPGQVASPNDWIIRGVAGEFYPCKPDIFAKTYEAVIPNDPHLIVEGKHAGDPDFEARTR